jgi:sulfonate transport system permease protein
LVAVNVILPATLPEMQSTMFLCLGLGWGAVLGAEFLGAQSGLCCIIVYGRQFAYIDRISLVALLFILCTSLSYVAVRRLAARLTGSVPLMGRT